MHSICSLNGNVSGIYVPWNVKSRIVCDVFSLFLLFSWILELYLSVFSPKLLSLLCLVGRVQFKYRIMGRKAGSLYINPKKFGSLHKPCMKEMITFVNCLAVNNNCNDKCVRHKELLSACMDSQVIQLFWIIASYSSPIFFVLFFCNFLKILIMFFLDCPMHYISLKLLTAFVIGNQ